MHNTLLLVSSSNNGGLSIIDSNGEVRKVDSKNTTGLEVYGDRVYRAIQKSDYLELIVYSEDKVFTKFFPKIKDIHDIKVIHGKLYLVSTGSNQIYVLDEQLKEEKVYTFDGQGDSWHINCLMTIDNAIYCSSFCELKEHYQYKGNTLQNGFIFNINTLKKITTGLSQPHSPFFDSHFIYTCNSENKELIVKDLDNQIVKTIDFGHYTRGLYIDKGYAYIGLSKNRNSRNIHESAKVLQYDLNNFNAIQEFNIPFDEVYDIKAINEKHANIIIEHPYKKTLLHRIELNFLRLLTKVKGR